MSEHDWMTCPNSVGDLIPKRSAASSLCMRCGELVEHTAEEPHDEPGIGPVCADCCEVCKAVSGDPVDDAPRSPVRMSRSGGATILAEPDGFGGRSSAEGNTR